MEKTAPHIDDKKEESFTLVLNNKPNNPEFVIEISLLSGKINIQAVNSIGNDILNYESSYDFDALVKIDDYFKFCKDINKAYGFIVQLKNNNSISLTKENESILLCLHLSQPIESILKIPLDKSSLNNKSLILSLYDKNIKLKEKIKVLEDHNRLLKLRLIKRDLKDILKIFCFWKMK